MENLSNETRAAQNRAAIGDADLANLRELWNTALAGLGQLRTGTADLVTCYTTMQVTTALLWRLEALRAAAVVTHHDQKGTVESAAKALDIPTGSVSGWRSRARAHEGRTWVTDAETATVYRGNLIARAQNRLVNAIDDANSDAAAEAVRLLVGAGVGRNELLPHRPANDREKLLEAAEWLRHKQTDNANVAELAIQATAVIARRVLKMRQNLSSPHKAPEEVKEAVQIAQRVVAPENE